MAEHQRDRDLVTPAAPSATPHRPSVVVLVPLVVLAALPLILLRSGTAPISDPDTLWHIVAGRELWSTWQFAGPDPLARFTPLPFVYHQWLPELVLAAADGLAGLPGVAWVFTVMLMGFVVALYAACRGQAGLLAAVLATVAGWVGAGGSLSPRPQVVGFVLLAVSVGVWLRTERDLRLRWWLLPLTWLWACVHGTWVYGVALTRAVRPRPRCSTGGSTDAPPSRVGLGAAAMVVLALLTPVGPRLLATPVAISQVSPFINEWKPTSITDPHAAATLLMGLVVVVVWMRGRTRVSWTRLLLWVVAMGSALHLRAHHRRRRDPCGPPLRRGRAAGAPRAGDPPAMGGAHPRRGRRWPACSLAALVVPATARAPGDVPSAFDPALRSLPQGTVVWNVDALGGWLLYAHPNVDPTMDTRAEVYGPDYLRSYVRAISGYPGWQETVARTGARYALVSTDGALADGLHAPGALDRGRDRRPLHAAEGAVSATPDSRVATARWPDGPESHDAADAARRQHLRTGHAPRRPRHRVGPRAGTHRGALHARHGPGVARLGLAAGHTAGVRRRRRRSCSCRSRTSSTTAGTGPTRTSARRSARTRGGSPTPAGRTTPP